MLGWARRAQQDVEEYGVVGDESPQFGQRLRGLREAAGLTQAELAERAGLSEKAIGALERGRRQRPYPHTVRALADALELTPDERAELTGALPTRAVAPVPAPAPATSARLPASPTGLIGRERELAEVVGLLRSGMARQLTLTGPGGVGKTQLALEAARRLQGAFAGGSAFVPLAPLGDPSLVLPTIAQTLGLTETGHVTALELLVARLGHDPWLLVLDNFEHVLDAAADLADLLAACPAVTLLVTSRAPLKLRAEREYPVRPLALPDAGPTPTPDDIAHVSSVRLFLERARAAAPGFELTASNCAAVAAICRRLDGLPLALELVAARARALGPLELLARLDHLLPLLIGGSRDLPQRQQTMAAAINWSYELLSPAEQALFRRLAVFAGGWTLEAAEAVTTWDTIAAADVIDLLSGLVEQSLVVAETGPEGATRYRMLEPIRQFAAQRVEERGEHVTLNDAHLDWRLAFAQRAAGELRGPAQRQWLDWLEHDHDNLRATLAWAEQDATRSLRGLQLAAALWRFWALRGHLAEGRRWLDTALSAEPDAPADLRAEALNAAGNLARDQGDYAQSRALHEASLALRRELGDERAVGLSLNNLGTVLLDRGEYEQGTQLYAEALARFREHGVEWEVAIALHNLGLALGLQGEYELAGARLEEALVLWERLDESASRARSLDALGEVARKRGQLERAAGLHAESLTLRRVLGDTRGIAISLGNLGLVAQYRGDFAEAVRLIEEALELRRALGDTAAIGQSLSGLASVARRSGDTARAGRLYREAVAARRQLGTKEELADCFHGLAAVALVDGDALRAARLLGASEALREATRQVVAPVDRADYDATAAAIERALPPAEWQHALAAGRDLSLDSAIAEALAEDDSVTPRQPPASS
jgi:predicted ATPase/DNA-binding XRE family transcriptional regulator